MVIWESSIHIAVELHHFTTQRLQQNGYNDPRHSIATVNHHFQRPAELHIANNPIYVIRQQVLLSFGTRTLQQIPLLNSLTQSRNGLTRQSFSSHNYFETIILGRIVAPRQHNPCIGT